MAETEPVASIRPTTSAVPSLRSSFADEPLRDFLRELLADQQRLQTPVARFAAFHHGSCRLSEPSAFSRSLVPFTAPEPDEQYAFEVDLDACSGCKACVAACHSLNGLDETETWRDVGLLTGTGPDGAFQQTVTTACHHCADPACLNGCPVLAYEKDPVTGIVRHLDDQCIGCQYCVLKCPYDVPKYNARLGIVRKCDMCQQRLGAGEAPACAQACPTHAIRIVKVAVSRDAGACDVSGFLPVAPDPAYTRPTTRYVTTRGLPDKLRAADADSLRPQPAHWPLVLMLVLTQLAVGAHAASLFPQFFAGSEARDNVTYYVTLPLGNGKVFDAVGWLAVGLGGVGLAASVAHLGQPVRAWKIFLGWRRSWLSREAVVFGGWLPLLLVSLPAGPLANGGIRFLAFAGGFALQLGAAALVLGAAGVFCSAMIYVDTRRAAWRAGSCFGRFLGTVAVGLAVGLHPIAGALAIVAKLAFEGMAARRDPVSTRRLMSGPFRRTAGVRRALGGSGAALLLLAAAGEPAAVALGVVLVILGELTERRLFFRTVDAPKMPGVPSA